MSSSLDGVSITSIDADISSTKKGLWRFSTLVYVAGFLKLSNGVELKKGYWLMKKDKIRGRNMKVFEKETFVIKYIFGHLWAEFRNIPKYLNKMILLIVFSKFHCGNFRVFNVEIESVKLNFSEIESTFFRLTEPIGHISLYRFFHCIVRPSRLCRANSIWPWVDTVAFLFVMRFCIGSSHQKNN